jgi:hypothetical protein
VQQEQQVHKVHREHRGQEDLKVMLDQKAIAEVQDRKVFKVQQAHKVLALIFLDQKLHLTTFLFLVMVEMLGLLNLMEIFMFGIPPHLCGITLVKL